MIYTKRVSDPAHERDGHRVFVDVSWHPDVRSQDVTVHEHVEGLGPEPSLVDAFARRPERYALFAHGYRAQLRARHPLAAAERLIRRARKQRVTLVYFGTDPINEPVFVLQNYLAMLLAARRSKVRLRKSALHERSLLSSKERAEKSREAAERVLGMPALRRARKVALYLSVGDEADTWYLAEQLCRRGAAVYAPKIVSDPPRLHWGLLSPRFSRQRPGHLVPGPYQQIPEPVVAVPAQDIGPDVVIVPVVAFDRSGYRIGYGGGYFDRTLVVWPDALRIGLAFECQQVEQVPREPHDIPLDWLVTELSATPFAKPER